MVKIRFKYALIDKRKPITGMGYLELVMCKCSIVVLVPLVNVNTKPLVAPKKTMYRS